MDEVLMVGSVTLLIISITLYYRYISRTNKDEKETQLSIKTIDCFPDNRDQINIENEKEFISIIVDKYDTYEEFLTSIDFDNYFTYWNTHPEILEMIKKDIEEKKNTTFKYKKINY